MRIAHLAAALWVAAGLAVGPRLGAQQVAYAVGSWKTEGLGNHRAIVEIGERTEAVWAHLPWRRRDAEPEKKAVLVYDAAGERVANAVALEVNREHGDVVFEPMSGPGTYHVYYLPHATSGLTYSPTVQYAPPEATADGAWLERNHLTEGERWRELPQATLVRFEACSEFHRLDPMEIIATEEETRALVARNPGKPLLVFPEDRRLSIRMTDDLPSRWIERGAAGGVEGEAARNEFFAFQLGLCAVGQDANNVAVRFSDLTAENYAIPASAFTCINLSGTDWLGRPMHPRVSVPAEKVQALWCGVHVPRDAGPGTYTGEVVVSADGVPDCTVPVALTVRDAVLEDGGVSDLGGMARLKWLNSTIGLDEEVTAPYTPLEVDGRTVRCLGRRVRWDDAGLLQSIRCGEQEILAAPMGIEVEITDGPVIWKDVPAKVTHRASGVVTWRASRKAGALSMQCDAKMEADGYLNYSVTLAANQATDLQDVRLSIPLRREVATYMMGLGKRGGPRPKTWEWKWDAGRANNMVWVGDAHAGLHLKLKGPQDEWHLWGVERGALETWANAGLGGCNVTEEGEDAVLVRAYTGPRRLEAGEKIELRFGLLITPVKPLDPGHWNQRYIHEYNTVPDLDSVVADGANIINIHQGNDHNPYINYPFLATEKLAAYAAAAHERGLKVKTYYTVRELSNFTREIFALRSLGRDVFTGGGGGGDSWLQEHLVSDYAAAWHQPYANGEVDAAIVTQGLSRWHNYYLEGLGWLIRNMGIDGLYLDGIGYDREIMKRVRKVMDRARPGCLIDFHSGNSYDYNNGQASPACLYMEHFPYIDSLWFGEMYDYDLPPDYWLVEISGIPFGLYGEMLQHGGNPWRGMLYGMTNRLHWQGDPRAIWKLWDEFGITEATMVGYWEPDCPVRADSPDVLATVYRKPGQSLLSVASWSKERVDCRLEIDWKALGLDPKRAHLFAPEVKGFQPCRLYAPDEAIPVPPGRGWLFIVDEEPHEAPPQVDAYASRRALLEDNFGREALGEAYTTALSETGEASAALRDGALQIAGMDNCFAFAERALPAGTNLVQCVVGTGTDMGATWGPGLTLIWPDGKVLRINVRSTGTFGVDDGGEFVFNGQTTPGAEYYLRLRIESDTVAAEASIDGDFWDAIHNYPRERFPGHPSAVRIGKGGPGGRAEDHSTMARPGTCTIRKLAVYGGK